MNLSRYNKTLAALAIGCVGWGYQVVDSAAEQITSREWVDLAFAGATALGVYAVSNRRR